MKKLILIFLCLALLFLSSCAKAFSKEEESTPIDDVSSNVSNEQQALTDDKDIGIALSSYEEYAQYMATHDIPKSFISYEELTAFGDFSSCILRDDGSEPLYQSYSYAFVSGEQVWFLSIYHNSQDADEQTTFEPHSEDMRFCDAGTWQGCYEGIWYCYNLDALHCVSWKSGDVGFSLYGTPNLCHYSGNNVPINQLLNKETAPSFKAMCDDYIAKKTAEN